MYKYTSNEHNLSAARRLILDEMHHPYMSAIVRRPVLDECLMALASLVLHVAGVTAIEKDRILSTVILIHHGLSIHDEIDEAAAHPDKRHRQLSVLAGDFYSSKYVRLLTQINRPDLMGRLALAISRMNEYKAEREMNIQQFSFSIDQYVQLTEQIYGELLYALIGSFLGQHPYWENVVRSFIHAHLWSQEYLAFEEGEHGYNLALIYVNNQGNAEEKRLIRQYLQEPLSDNRIISFHVKYGTSSFLYENAMKSLRTYSSQMASIPDPETRMKLESLIGFIELPLQLQRKVVEEG